VNWFEQHLNWTAVSIGLVWYIAGGIGASWLGWLIGLVVCLLMYGWVLRQKNRSLSYLLVLFIPFGWIWFLALENRKGMLQPSNKI